ncbi:hypothetical protein [Streptomyces sp. NPDC090022]|uniref:hypothetical protein n=1 Tax=Streptomyces sp. NPDC090022 TaxID=3365920 RepID=UPI00382B5956
MQRASGERPFVEEPRLTVHSRSSGSWSRRLLLLFFLPAPATVPCATSTASS